MKKQIMEIMKEHDLRVTKGRTDLIECLVEHEKVHFHSVAEIRKHKPHMNEKSIYNNIKALDEIGLIDKYIFGNEVKYAISDHLVEHKSIHIVSKKKWDHVDVDHNVFESIKKAVKKAGYEPKEIKIFVEID